MEFGPNKLGLNSFFLSSSLRHLNNCRAYLMLGWQCLYFQATIKELPFYKPYESDVRIFTVPPLKKIQEMVNKT